MDQFINQIMCGDCLEIMKQWPDNCIDAVLTDPPYGWSFMNKKWDADVPTTEIWQEVYRVLKPGGHLLVACGTRTYHKSVTNIEESGFEIRDCIVWAYGSGMPKGQNISVGIDKELGCEREVIGKKIDISSGKPMSAKQAKAGSGMNINEGWDRPWRKDEQRCEDMTNITLPSSPEAKLFDGYNTNLKPAIELWCLARKPIAEKTIAKNVLKYGTGGLNIGDCKVPVYIIADKSQIRTLNRGQRYEDRNGQTWGFNKQQSDNPQVVSPDGRYPSNLILSDDPEIKAMFPETNSGVAVNQNRDGSVHNKIYGARKCIYGDNVGYYDPGSASRYFKTIPTDNMTPNDTSRENCIQFSENKHQFNYGEETNTSASRFFYCAKASKKERGEFNNHPTVKPLQLMEYLVTLIMPKNGIVCDPFMGSGTTIIAAINKGFSYVGCEKSSEYFAIAERRIDKCLENINLKNPSLFDL